VKILNKNGLPYSIRVLFAPGVIILPTGVDLSDSLYKGKIGTQKKSLKSSSMGKIITPGANNTRME